jgi:glucosylceramidase
MSDISQKPLKPDQEYMKFLSQKTVLICFVLPGLFLLNFGCHQKQASEAVEFWLTNPDRSALFEKQSAPLSFGKSPGQQPIIDVDETQDFQTIDGFGFTLTGGSAMLINRMSATARAALLQELFDTDSNNIGVSYLRLSIGASDLDDRVFSYDDLPAGQADPELEKFSLEPDRQQLIPVLKEILAINPAIKILGSPWSPPTWDENQRGFERWQFETGILRRLRPVFRGIHSGHESRGHPNRRHHDSE